MSICRSYMALDEAERAHIRYLWDDTRASEDFEADAEWVLDAANALSLRAQMVLAVGIYEWIACRFRGLDRDDTPARILQAAWCATVDPRYLEYFELTREDWRGPVRGPLWCATTWLRPVLADGDVALGEVADGLQYLTRLALHVLPAPDRFVTWTKAILDRFSALYPAQLNDPFDDLFDVYVGARRGRLIDRAALDPTLPYDGSSAIASVRAMLAEAAKMQNEFLASPEEMKRMGFPGTPYALDDTWS